MELKIEELAIHFRKIEHEIHKHRLESIKENRLLSKKLDHLINELGKKNKKLAFTNAELKEFEVLEDEIYQKEKLILKDEKEIKLRINKLEAEKEWQNWIMFSCESKHLEENSDHLVTCLLTEEECSITICPKWKKYKDKK